MPPSIRMLPPAARAFPRPIPPRTTLLRPFLSPPLTRSFKTTTSLYSSTNSDNNSNNLFNPSPPSEPQPHFLPDFDLTSHVILITGGAQGLGLTFASSLLSAGATIYALDRLPQPSPTFLHLQQTTPSPRPKTPRLRYRQVDVRDTTLLNKTVSDIADAEGRMDGLIAAAGIQQETPALDYSASDANAMLEINVTGVFTSAQAVARQMLRLRQPSGSILLIASMSSHVANRGLPCCIYNASKAAVVQLARSLAAEWGEYGIRVNSLSPGYVRTEMVERLFERMPERKERWAGENMLGRVGETGDFGGVVVLAMAMGKGKGGYMTGTDLRVDGGHCAW